MSEARHILDQYLQRTGLRSPSDAAQQFQVTLLRSWIDHLDAVLEANRNRDLRDPEARNTIIREFIYGAVPEQAEAELRVEMHADMTYWAERARIDPSVLADLGLPPDDPPGQVLPPDDFARPDRELHHG
jgi:hypothetical protein